MKTNQKNLERVFIKLAMAFLLRSNPLEDSLGKMAKGIRENDAITYLKEKRKFLQVFEEITKEYEQKWNIINEGQK